MNGIFAQRRARLLSMKAVREAGPPASPCIFPDIRKS